MDKKDSKVLFSAKLELYDCRFYVGTFLLEIPFTDLECLLVIRYNEIDPGVRLLYMWNVM